MKLGYVCCRCVACCLTRSEKLTACECPSDFIVAYGQASTHATTLYSFFLLCVCVCVYEGLGGRMWLSKRLIRGLLNGGGNVTDTSFVPAVRIGWVKLG